MVCYVKLQDSFIINGTTDFDPSYSLLKVKVPISSKWVYTDSDRAFSFRIITAQISKFCAFEKKVERLDH